MTTHTQGKLTLGEHGTYNAHLLNESRQSIANISSAFSPQTGEAHANARRLVACWNVCEGLDTDYIEYAARTNNFVGAVQWLTAERDQANNERDHYQRCYHEASNHIRDCTDADQLKAAQAINAELLAALEHVLNVIPAGGFAQIHHKSDTYAQILAAVDKAKDGAA